MTSPYIDEGARKHCKYCLASESERHRKNCERPQQLWQSANSFTKRMTNCPYCDHKALPDENIQQHIAMAHLQRSLMATWTVKYQYRLPGKFKPGEVYTEDVAARLCSIINDHLIFEGDTNHLLRAFAPGRWIEVKLKDD